MRRKIIGILVCMLLIVTVLPVSGTLIIDNTASSNMSGKTLYVGGSGDGNYTKIQDAIDNATDEDTVYVFDESSPYLEKIIINKSINIFGENPNTVIIDGNGNGKVVDINVDWVNFRGFTIRHGDRGIVIHSNYSIIIDNNIILNNEEGIYLSGSSNNAIRKNNISENEDGIYFRSSNSNAILGNTISNNDDGIYLYDSFSNTILKNNIINNEQDSFFWRRGENIWKSNSWSQNYWNKPRILPKLILGVIYAGGGWGFPQLWFPWFSIDWNPANEPYDI